MSEFQFPDGRYLSLSGMIRAGTGGQTRALLMRNRLLAQHAGIEPALLTFDSAPVYAGVRASLAAQGQLAPPVRLLNIFEEYRSMSLAGSKPIGDCLPAVEGFVAEDEVHPDGSVYRTRYLHKRSGDEAIHDYRRPDGSVFLRAPAGASAETNPATPYLLVNGDGQPVASWTRRGGWHRHWLRLLAGVADRVIVISDSRVELAHILPMRDPRFHILHLMHNTHTVGRRRWNSPLSGAYGPLLQGIRDLDGLVTLTHRQRDDVAMRYGETSNLFVVPNPVELPERPDPLPARDERRFAIVSRLERQKRLDHAIRAFALVLEREPEARLDVYGDGTLRIPLQGLIDELGVRHAVRLRGHDPRAREALWTATGFLMTSGYEGYPLATLESMSHGCPVVSYDIKYGPREQITDGVDGFLVPAEDVTGMADRVVRMIRDPRLVARMSSAALEKAARHDHRAFLRDWRAAVEAAIGNKPLRNRLEGVDLDVRCLGWVARPAFPRRAGRVVASSRTFRRPRRMRFSGTLRLRGPGPRRTLASVAVSLDAVCDGSGATASIPVVVRRSRRRFDVASTFDPAEVFAALPEADRAVRLRLRLVWQNSSWETYLRRPQEMAPRHEVSFADDGELHLQRAIGAAG